MPTIETVAKFVNAGISKKTGEPYYNIKNEKDEVFWATEPIKHISQGATVRITYHKDRGSNQIDKVEAVTNGTGNTSQYRAETPSRDAERIWVQGVLQQFIAAGKVPLDLDALDKATSIVRMGYRRAWTAPQITSAHDRPPLNEEMEDEVPYR